MKVSEAGQATQETTYGVTGPWPGGDSVGTNACPSLVVWAATAEVAVAAAAAAELAVFLAMLKSRGRLRTIEEKIQRYISKKKDKPRDREREIFMNGGTRVGKESDRGA